MSIFLQKTVFSLFFIISILSSTFNCSAMIDLGAVDIQVDKDIVEKHKIDKVFFISKKLLAVKCTAKNREFDFERLQLYDIETGRSIDKLQPISSNWSHFYVGDHYYPLITHDDNLQLYCVETGRAKFDKPYKDVKGCAWNDKIIAFVTSKMELKLYDKKSNKYLRKVKILLFGDVDSEDCDIAMEMDDSVVAIYYGSSHERKYVQLYDIQTCQPKLEPLEYIMYYEFCLERGFILKDDSHYTRAYDSKTGNLLWEEEIDGFHKIDGFHNEGHYNYLETSSDFKFLLISANEGWFGLCGIQKEGIKYLWRKYESVSDYSRSFSNDSSLLAVLVLVEECMKLKVYDVQTGELKWQKDMNCVQPKRQKVLFSPDDTLLALLWGNTLYLYDAATGESFLENENIEDFKFYNPVKILHSVAGHYALVAGVIDGGILKIRKFIIPSEEGCEQQENDEKERISYLHEKIETAYLRNGPKDPRFKREIKLSWGNNLIVPKVLLNTEILEALVQKQEFNIQKILEENSEELDSDWNGKGIIRECPGNTDEKEESPRKKRKI